jgi:hypothetical protein
VLLDRRADEHLRAADGRFAIAPEVVIRRLGGRTFFATTGFTYEDRDGGTPDGQVLRATASRTWKGWRRDDTTPVLWPSSSSKGDT